MSPDTQTSQFRLGRPIEELERGNELPATDLWVFMGTSVSGKATTVAAVGSALEAEGCSVKVIDQGKKFRSLTYLGLDEKIDFSDQDQITRFLQAPSTRDSMLDLLAMVEALTPTEQYELLHGCEVNAVVKEIGSNDLSHPIAVGLMYDEVSQAVANGTNAALLDGRAIDKYGIDMHENRIVNYLGGFFIECDPIVAARRVLFKYGILPMAAQPYELMDQSQRMALSKEADSIRQRNLDDASRDVDPVVYPELAYNLDLVQGLPTDAEMLEFDLDVIEDTKMVTVDTSHTSSIRQMTDPITTIVTGLTARANQKRRAIQELAGILVANV